MKTIRYGLHFGILPIAVFIFWLAKDAALGDRTLNYRACHYGLMGGLHAISIVVSLRDRKMARPIKTLGFVLLAVVLSAATPILALWGGAVTWAPVLVDLPPNPTRATILFLITGSALGSAGYWMLVRLFWLSSLRFVDLLKTVGLCVVGTSLAVATSTVLSLGKGDARSADLSELALTAIWWFAFSISLYWSEMSNRVVGSPIGGQTGKLTVS